LTRLSCFDTTYGKEFISRLKEMLTKLRGQKANTFEIIAQSVVEFQGRFFSEKGLSLFEAVAWPLPDDSIVE
jgi:hypothetical protein